MCWLGFGFYFFYFFMVATIDIDRVELHDTKPIFQLRSQFDFPFVEFSFRVFGFKILTSLFFAVFFSCIFHGANVLAVES